MPQKSWRQQWLEEQAQLEQQREEQRQQRQQRRRSDDQQRREEASRRLHQFCLELGVTELELVDLLDVEREWFAADVFYQPDDPA